MSNIFKDKIYLEQAAKVKKSMDLASKQQKEIFDTPWYTKHFTMGDEHVAGKFDTILDKMHMTIAASTIQRKSEMPLRALEGIDTISQSMFTYAHGFRIETDEIRTLVERYMIAKGTGNMNAVERVKSDILKKIFEVKSKAVDGVRARLDIIILGALFNNGVFTFTEENDPGSPYVGSSIDLKMPAANKWETETTGGRDWTIANKATFDVVADLTDIRNAAKGRKPKYVLISRERMDVVLQSEKLMHLINDNTKPDLPLSDELINTFLSARGLPTFEVVERAVRIQNGDSFGKEDYVPFDGKSIVLIPDQHLGTIETRLSDAELGIKDDDVEYSYYDRIELHEYTLGEKQGTSYTEITKAVLTAAPAVDTINYIHCMKVDHAA